VNPVRVPTSDVNSETAVITEWHAPDRALVSSGDLVAEVETSKAILDVTAAMGGYLLHGAAAGDQVRLSEPIAWVFPDLATLDEHARRVEEADQVSADGPRATVPATRRAAELGVDLDALRASGLITVKEVEEAAAAAAGAEAPDPLPARPGAQRLVILGAGLGATQVLEILAAGEGQQALAVVDDDRSRWGGGVCGVPVVGGQDRLRELAAGGAFDAAVIAISTSIRARTRLREACERMGLPLANVIDPTARFARDVVLGRGNVVCAFCHFGVATRFGDNNFLSAYNSFDHHNVLGSDISTGPGCKTSGLVTLGDRVRLGTGIFMEPHVEIGDGVQVASGAVIVASVPAKHAVKTRIVTTTTVPLR
jgi:acetyltransferase-like isoleucine patch superfamily enzyme